MTTHAHALPGGSATSASVVPDNDAWVHEALRGQFRGWSCSRVHFAYPLDTRRSYLVELPQHVLSALEEREEIQFKGAQASTGAVLCTHERTYALQFRENSNALFLLDQSASASLENGAREPPALSLPIRMAMHGSVELTHTAPHVRPLRDLLAPHILKSGDGLRQPSNESSSSSADGLGIEWSIIEEQVLASAAEIRSTLKELCAVERNSGVWIRLDPDLVLETLSLLFDTIILQQWCSAAFPRDELESEMAKDCAHELVRAVVGLFCTPSERHTGWEQWDRDRLLRFSGEHLLEQRCSTSPDEELDFMSAWGKLLPDDVKPELGTLRGLFVMDRTRLKYTPYWRLSIEPAMRFSQLFALQSSWSRSEIEPFLKDLCGENEGHLDQMLRRHAKLVHGLGGQNYVARAPVIPFR
ncbi:Sister chromatid cohesion protein DCC1 [Porphyridium purpureum]|uniref:Sister chromatid cohesion protein DCC1 n=1 Tax=Porphyridium purpureum TaxID=35688 RepID=A0A5J4YLI2_PORPP|nr:Sister chromatid cohesion protein DCC1 [Porphyridium purpureum]|eukprot:POR6551..scf249_10